MNRDEYVRAANTESFTTVKGENTGRQYAVRNHTYGVLVPDHDYPLSAVSVANSSLSIDLWRGCAWQCSYCHVQGTLTDLGEDLRMPKRPEQRTRFTIDEIIDALVEHPFFLRDESVISIGTASTEPFASGSVTESTFEVMDAFVRRGLRNPFWIVTKAGVPEGCRGRLTDIVAATRGLLISICWANNPANIEPARNNRFTHCAEASMAGASVSWYLRPIAPEWSGTPENLEMMMLWVKANYGPYISSIVPGGLRWTEGIEYGLVEIHHQPLPEIPRDDNVKSLPDDLWQHIVTLSARHFPGVPVFYRSSCALTHLLRRSSITSVHDLYSNDCLQSICPAEQRQHCNRGSRHTLRCVQAQAVLDRLGVPAQAVGLQHGRLITEPPLGSFTYAIRQTVEKALALEVWHGNND